VLIPAPRLLALIAILALAALAASMLPGLRDAWILLAIACALVALTDALLLARTASPDAQRMVPGTLALGVRREVVLRLTNPHRFALALAVFDHHPSSFEVTGQPQQVRIDAGKWSELRYAVRPLERGDQRFAPLELRIASRLGLWEQRRRSGAETLLRVYPNFAAITKYALLATDNRLSQIGILQRRRRGEGQSFHQLREYRQGDALRSIDWKASARTRKLIAREYEEERDQRVVFLIDCGRRMTAQDGPLSHFDHMLNAALLLAYVSLRQGDAVGLMTMGTEAIGATRFMAPRKSAAAIGLVLNAVYALQPTLASSDYNTAALELMRRVRKRALVVILSNLRDEDDDDLMPALRLLQSRHLVLFASLRERILGDALTQPVRGFDDALTHAAAAEYLQRRDATFRRLAGTGAILLDVEPEGLPVALVNRYLDAKRSGRL
jgi:uncharacterized protein (DUF58 family)